MPYPTIITTICCSLLIDPTFNEKQMPFKYANNIFLFLTEKDKHAIFLFDEISINSSLDYKMGNIVGTECNNI